MFPTILAGNFLPALLDPDKNVKADPRGAGFGNPILAKLSRKDAVHVFRRPHNVLNTFF